MSPTIRHKYKYFHSTVQRAKDKRPKFHFCRLRYDHVTWNLISLNLSIEIRSRRVHSSMRTKGITAFSKQIRRCSVDGRKRYEHDKCGRKSFWKRSKTAPFSFENGRVWKRISVDGASYMLRYLSLDAIFSSELTVSFAFSSGKLFAARYRKCRRTNFRHNFSPNRRF